MKTAATLSALPLFCLNSTSEIHNSLLRKSGNKLNKQDNATGSDDFEVEDGESESDDEDEDLDECEYRDEFEEMGIFMGM